jgi:hypothetical protein
LGASVFQRPPTHHVERFLFMLGIDLRGKVNDVKQFAGPKAIDTGM